MSAEELTPQEAARWAARAGLPLEDDRHPPVAATAQYIHSVVSVLRELDFGDTPPAPAYRMGPDAAVRAEEEKHDAAV
ncbi:hypothetical protein FM076_17370 [Streptomyces albus subsp. chlorinus]|uniref:hypothetical protein n=1 Tax=Streptomyces albus TaxID=1888 RepID=UPI00156DB5F3|nr:hypothetical protein [Streptomyces albus]NSC22844.1 hypothetical protein [Streptomyces albus subsp. chlorinus]